MPAVSPPAPVSSHSRLSCSRSNHSNLWPLTNSAESGRSRCSTAAGLDLPVLATHGRPIWAKTSGRGIINRSQAGIPADPRREYRQPQAGYPQHCHPDKQETGGSTCVCRCPAEFLSRGDKKSAENMPVNDCTYIPLLTLSIAQTCQVKGHSLG